MTQNGVEAPQEEKQNVASLRRTSSGGKMRKGDKIFVTIFQLKN